MTDTARQLLSRIEAIDSAAADNRLRAQAYQRMAEELKDAAGRATSPDGAVTVVVGPGGSITSVTFTDQIHTIAPDALSSALLRAIAEAKASAARMQAEVIRRGLGDTELLDRVLDTDERLFGDAQAPVPPAPAAQSAEPPIEDDETFDIFTGPKAAAPASPPPKRVAEEPIDDFENFDIYGSQP